MGKKEYITPDMEIIEFEADDVITKSEESSNTELEIAPI